MARSFLVVALEFENETASRIAEQTQSLIKENPSISPRDYRAFVEEQLQQETELLEELRRPVSDESLDRYESALDELQATIEAEEDIVEVVNAQDRVSEAADWFERSGARLTLVGEKRSSVPLSLRHLVEDDAGG
jgi:Zn-dependent oligopeptidase